ncbi:MAG: hypothetical protein NVS3B20_21430 [Polyangiales bacterium]
MSPVLLGAVGIFVVVRLKGAPAARIDPQRPGKDTSRVRPLHQPDDRAKETPNAPEKRSSPGEIIGWLFSKPPFLFALVLSILLTFIRVALLSWAPTFLASQAKVATHTGASIDAVIPLSIVKSAVFPACGIISAIVVGRVSDRFGAGRRGALIAVCLVAFSIAAYTLSRAGVAHPVATVVSLGACGLFLLGPYSLISGACTLDIAEAKGAATAVGILDGAGYVGASLAGIVIGTTATDHGWTAALDIVAVIAILGAAVAAAWALWERRQFLADPLSRSPHHR